MNMQTTNMAGFSFAVMGFQQCTIWGAKRQAVGIFWQGFIILYQNTGKMYAICKIVQTGVNHLPALGEML